jgi:hypothetical protein
MIFCFDSSKKARPKSRLLKANNLISIPLTAKLEKKAKSYHSISRGIWKVTNRCEEQFWLGAISIHVTSPINNFKIFFPSFQWAVAQFNAVYGDMDNKGAVPQCILSSSSLPQYKGSPARKWITTVVPSETTQPSATIKVA